MPTEQPAQHLPDEQLSADAERHPSSGEVLQTERMRRGLSEKEVADRLHITMHYVKALETNQFEKLPGAVFAKGYIKSYALLLKLDEDKLIGLYEDLQAHQQAEKDDANSQLARHKKDRNRPFVIASVVGFVGVFLGLWAYNNYYGTESIEDSTEIVADNDLGEILTDPPAIPEQLSEPILDPINTGPEVATTTNDVAEEAIPETPALNYSPTESPVSSPSDFVSALVSIGALDPTAVSPTEPAQDVDLVTVSIDSAEANEPRLIEISAAGNDILRITFSGESWIEVNDSEANQIYRDIRGAGDVLEITGNAPFNILLGDAPFTQLSLNGTEIDVSDNIRIDNSARLTVGL